jgi:hypothetical protein
MDEDVLLTVRTFAEGKVDDLELKIFVVLLCLLGIAKNSSISSQSWSIGLHYHGLGHEVAAAVESLSTQPGNQAVIVFG